eukprot:11115866-Karenia_brevis.AAC.1
MSLRPPRKRNSVGCCRDIVMSDSLVLTPGEALPLMAPQGLFTGKRLRRSSLPVLSTWPPSPSFPTGHHVYAHRARGMRACCPLCLVSK